MKRALCLLRNNKNENEVPNTINFFFKYEETILLKERFQQILLSNEIPTQWKSSVIININKGHLDREKFGNKRGISLTSNIAKLFEKTIIKRLNNHLQFTEAQTGAQPGTKKLTS